MLFELREGRFPVRCAVDTVISAQAWSDFAKNMEREEGLAQIDPTVLAQRYQRQESIVIMHRGAIISHVSFSPSLMNGTIVKDGKLIKEVPALANEYPIYLVKTAWTAPAFRSKGLGAFMGKQIYEKYGSKPALFFGISAHNQALNLSKRFGAIPVKPTKYPFLYMLSSIHSANTPIDKMCARANASFWVSNELVAAKLNTQIAGVAACSASDWAEALEVDPRWHQWKH